MSSERVQLVHRDHIVEIVLNRPEKRNAINWELMEALDAAVGEANRLPGARVILVRGAGKCFSAGLDLGAFLGMAQQLGEGWRDNLIPLTQTFQDAVSRLERCPLPTIALLHGHTLGLGMELALACDMRLAAESARLALPEARLGMIPDVGGTTRLTRLVGPARAKELILTGREATLEEAAAWGLVNHVVPEDQLMARAEALAADIAACAPLAVSLGKRVIDGLYDLDRGLQMEALAQSHLIKTRDMEAGAMAMLSKSRPVWQGK